MRGKLGCGEPVAISNQSLKKLNGMFRGRSSKPVMVEEMNAAIAQCAAEGVLGKAKHSGRGPAPSRHPVARAKQR